MGYLSYCGTDPIGKRGGTFLAWHSSVWCDIQDLSLNFAHVLSEDSRGNPFLLTFVYGFPELEHRHLLWDWFTSLSPNISLPWLALDDFNQIRNLGEKDSGSSRLVGANEFNLMISQCGFIDLVPNGLCFPNSILFAFPVVASSHAPILVDCCNMKPFRQRPFHFENMWLLFNKCNMLVNEVWREEIGGSPAFVIHKKIMLLCAKLKQWNKLEVGIIQEKIKSLTSQLEYVQQHVSSLDSKVLESNLSNNLEFYLDCEEMMWAQKAWQMWLINGDHNTSYFHKIVKKRCSQNHISALLNDQGDWVSDYEQIEAMGINYFSNIFSETPTFTSDQLLQQLSNYSIPELSPDQIGPDGLNCRFFKTFWADVGPDVVAMAQSFLQGGYMLKAMNSVSLLCLIIWLSMVVLLRNSALLVEFVKGIQITHGVSPISHLMYVDDTVLFFKLTPHNIAAVKRVLQKYSAFSGQQMNLSKSFLIFSPNTCFRTKKEVADDLDLRFHSKLGKYLGTWVDNHQSKQEVFNDVLNKLTSKLQLWKSKCLSQAGRLTLINSVITSSLIYPMSHHCFTIAQCRRLEQVMASFFWGYNGDNAKLHLQNWPSLCLPRHRGGLNFCKIDLLNQALLSKHLWRVLTNHPSLASLCLNKKYVDVARPGIVCKKSFCFSGVEGYNEVWLGRL
ncbi:reverse transcriptase [Senna tora]|uniref:Reverse transcriptase n=1 Tax=Senna tora TaxID=362788 RepID=A0A834T7R9_9FABA|nr:reverse transcriptase [Senna tora]